MSEPPADRVQELFDRAVELPVEQRDAFLVAACADDTALRAEVESLLAADAQFPESATAALLKSPLVREESVPASVQSPVSKPWVGPYRILRRIAEGGMGTVYEAEQDSPRRVVALKVVRPSLTSPTLLKRFQHEAEILGRLHHPGIAQVYEADLAADGEPYFAMEFIQGLPLDEHARLRSLTLSDRLELLARVCDAVQHAHDQGVIHRDLKPANILVDESGQPKVLDFGVARVTDLDMLTEAGLTKTGQLLGTPNYMSPEQVTADPAAIDHRADVYALGVILFELLAERLPYLLENQPLAETVRLILEEEPPRLGSLNLELRGDVDTVVSRALEKDPARRYPSAADLAADLRRYLANEPILARPPSALYYLRQFTRRHKALVGGVAATVVALILGLVGTILFAVGEARQRRVAEQHAEVAKQNGRAAEQHARVAEQHARVAEQNARNALAEKLEAEQQAYRASLAAAVLALSAHDVADAKRQLDAAPKELRGWEWRHLYSRLDDSSSVIAFRGQGFLLGAPSQQAATSEGSLQLAVFTNRGLRLTDLESGKHRTLPTGPHRLRPLTAAQTRLGLRVGVWVGARTFQLRDKAGQVLCRGEIPKGKQRGWIEVSPDGTRTAAHWLDGAWQRFTVYDATSGKQISLCNGLRSRINRLTFSPDGTRIASANDDHTAQLWSTATGELLATCKGHTDGVNSVAFRPDGARLVTTSSDGTVRQWDAVTGEEAGLLYARHSSQVADAAYSPDGQWIASVGFDRTVRVWRASDRQEITVLHGHTDAAIRVAFAPAPMHNRLRLASAGSSFIDSSPGARTVAVWDVDPQAPLPKLIGHTQAVRSLAYSPNGRWIASASTDDTVRLWDAATGKCRSTLPHSSDVQSLAFGPDGKRLLTVNYGEDRIRIWDVATARVRKEIQGPAGVNRFMKVRPDGKRVAVSGQIGRKHHFQVHDVATGDRLFSAEGSVLAYSPDGRWLAVQVMGEWTVLLLDAQTHETVARFQGHKFVLWGAAFSPDSRCLATCSRDHTVRLWQIDSGECRVLRGHSGDVRAVAFHPDGKRLATAGADRAVWLWDLERGEELVRLVGHTSHVQSLAFSPDGTTLASGSGDSTVRLWDTAPLRVRHQARRESEADRSQAVQ